MTPNITLTGPCKCVSCGEERKVLVKFDRAPPVCHECIGEAVQMMCDRSSQMVAEAIQGLHEVIHRVRDQ